MERWSGRVAVVTGASSGIGASIAQLLVKKGMKVVGLARRSERIEELAEALKDEPGKLYAAKADISKEEDILAAFKWVKDNLGGVDLLVNNAAVMTINNLSDGKSDAWRQVLDINVLAICICTKEAIKSMKERGVDDGHIVHINGVTGHYHLNLPGAAMFCAAKHTLRALTEGLRKELVQLKSNIRVTSISPGLVDTEMLRNSSSISQESLKVWPMLQPEDIAEAVVYAVSAPPRVQALAENLKDAPGKLYALKADLAKEEDILAAFKWVKDNLGGVDVLVNNAAVSPLNSLIDGTTDKFTLMLDVNVLAVSICTREALQSMKDRGVDDGHIIHINSIVGHYVPNFPGIYMLIATKHALTALTEGLRKELVQLKSNIRVTSISPGAVMTEGMQDLGLPEEFKNMPTLEPEDIADAVVYTLSTPPRVQIHEIMIHPTGERA